MAASSVSTKLSAIVVPVLQCICSSLIRDSLLQRSSFEGFFASKGAAYALPDGDFARQASKHGGEMQLHLQAMVNLLRDEDVLRLVIKLESQYPNRIRYLTIVSAFGPDEEEQSIVMGIDWTDKATIGLVVPLYRDTTIQLDGDGGFKMTSADRAHIFKPISVQTMWTALQWIHKCGDNARRNNYFYPNGSSHAWADYYFRKISSDRLRINEWDQMEDIESKRPESPIGTSTEKELIMKLIRHKLKEVMTRVDLEDVTCRQIRTMLEEETQMELKEYRSFIDEEMIIILGQMDSASKIFDHVFLGSEWNASNLEELKENGVGFILNITREIDNFFPGTFIYHNIRVYDLDETELLHHWDNTYKFIQRAKDAGSNVLVHCRMGISRSASTVIAYGMKEYGWSLGETMKYVKARRNVVQPNAGFWKQLITYEGILNSSNNRYNRLFRHGSFSTDADEVSKSAGAVKKRREKSPYSAGETDEQQTEGIDTVDNFPIETDDSNEKLGVVEETSENTDDLCISEDASLEFGKADSVPATSSPIGPCPEATVETNKEVLEETNSVASSSSVSEISVVEKTSLQRVRSVPALSSDDKKGQESDVEPTGNFRRSYSLRERGSAKKLQNLRIVTKAKSASDENLKEFERKKKEILGWEEEEARDSQDAQNFEKESFVDGTRGSLPRDLHGVLESGFVKRHSRRFEEGVYDAPELDDGVDLAMPEEMDVECAPVESDKITAEEGQVEDESTPSEEPEPGVVRKHKEGYELKHRESLKRRALHQRGGSDEGKSVKREGDEIEGVLDVGADENVLQPVDGLEDELSGVNVVALVKKVNEDMKKEVSVRRASASKKEQELRAFVQKAGEQMKDALANGEDESSQKDNYSVTDKLDSEQIGEASGTGYIKRKTRVLVLEEDAEELLSEDSQLTGSSSSECRDPVASEGDTKSATENIELVKPAVVDNVSASIEFTEKSAADEAETSEISVSGGDRKGGQDTEDVPPRGLVKRHTLLLEGKLQPLEQELEKEAEIKEGKENELTIDREVGLCLSKEETRNEVADTEHAKENVEVETVEKISPERADVSEVSEQDKKDAGSEHDAENVPQKGLVKRHTLLLEGKLQPLDQELEKNVEKETGKESEPMVNQKACPSPSKGEDSVATNTEQAELRVAQVASAVVKSEETRAAEKEETSELTEDRKDIGSENDTENVLQKGLVKRHTLLLEGRLQPFDQELDKDVEKDDGKEDDLTLDKEACLPASADQEQQRYQIERTNDSTVEQCEEEEQDNENVSGLVKRAKLRIEERLQPTVVESKQELEQLMDPDGSAAVDGEEEHCHEADKKEEGDEGVEQLAGEEEPSEVAVDTSSVVRVKAHTQHLEGIIRVKQDVEKIKRQTSNDDEPKTKDEPPKFFIVPRLCSNESMDEGNDNKITAEKRGEDNMDVLSDSAVNIALFNAQENLDAEKENLELENENFVDWDAANVKQRRQIFEDMRRKGDKENESKSNSLRRQESFPKMTHAAEKPALRRRSVSDVTATVSSGSDREVGYTIIFKNKVVASSSSSSLPRDWSPLECRQRKEDKGEFHTKEVFSPEIFRKDKLERNTSVELIKRQDKENETCLSVKETIQVLDSKNQRNINTII
ncbi:uncharacterized protein LOC144646386 isoform X3 [Oculina patagonica]